MGRKILVIEAGGTGFRRTVVEGMEHGEVVFPESPITSLGELVEFVKQGVTENIEAIAFSIAGFVQSIYHIEMIPNIHWLDDTPLGTIIMQNTGLPTLIANDANTSATGAHLYFPDIPYFALIIWSSGIGGAVYREGVGVLSQFEGGHVCVDTGKDAPLCNCGLQGCVEAFCGGVNVFPRVADILRGKNITPPTTKKELGEILDKSYEKDEDWAVSLYFEIADKMGHFLANTLLFHKVPNIIFKGAFAKAALVLSGIENLIRQSIQKHLPVPAWEEKLSINLLPTDIGKDTESFIGAAYLAEKKYFLK